MYNDLYIENVVTFFLEHSVVTNSKGRALENCHSKHGLVLALAWGVHEVKLNCDCETKIYCNI